MSWQSSFWSEIAVHIETGSKFSVKHHSNRIDSVEDIDIIPTEGNTHQWSYEGLLQLKNELWSHWEHQSLRSELSSLIHKNFYGELKQVASAISWMANKHVSIRTIQSWLIGLEKTSSRTCPQWAVNALKAYIDAPENQSELEFLKQKHSTYVSPSAIDSTLNNAVSIATTQIESEQRERERWKKISITELPEKIFSELESLRNDVWSLTETLTSIHNGIGTAKSFEECQQLVLKATDEQQFRRSEIRRTRRAIEERKEEFANPDGLAST